MRAFAESYGIEKSAVSDHFVRVSRGKLGGLLERPLDKLKLCVLYIDGIAPVTGAKHVHFQGMKLVGGFGGSYLRNTMRFTASESVIEEIQVGGAISQWDTTASTGASSSSAGDTIELELTGGGSRAAAPYATLTLDGEPTASIDSISSPAGNTIVVTITGTHSYDLDGEIVTVASSTGRCNTRVKSFGWSVRPLRGTSGLRISRNSNRNRLTPCP